MGNLYRGPSIDVSYQVSVHLAEGFQRRILKCEKLTDDGRQTTDPKWWQVKDKKDKHTKYYTDNYDWATQTALKHDREPRYSESVRSYCSTSGIRLVTLFKNHLISHELGKDRFVITTKHNVSITVNKK